MHALYTVHSSSNTSLQHPTVSAAAGIEEPIGLRIEPVYRTSVAAEDFQTCVFMSYSISMCRS
jgi:hypothetical protein